MLLFSAKWCNPCKGVKKFIEDNRLEVTTVDIEEQPEVTKQHGVRGVPTLVAGDQIYVGDIPIIEYLKRGL